MLSNVILTCTMGWGAYHARNLMNNYFSGQLPPALGLLTELQYL
jgi:hypothetical protein